MTDLQELIEVADRLCQRMEKFINYQSKFGTGICLELEQKIWEAFGLANEIRLCNEIREKKEEREKRKLYT